MRAGWVANVRYMSRCCTSDSTYIDNIHNTTTVNYSFIVMWSYVTDFNNMHLWMQTKWCSTQTLNKHCIQYSLAIDQECTVADDIKSRAEDCTFTVVVWQWLAIVIVLHSITVVCPWLLTVGDSVQFCTVPLQCLWHDHVILISNQYIVTYLLTY